MTGAGSNPLLSRAASSSAGLPVLLVRVGLTAGYAPFGGQETERNSGHRPVDAPWHKSEPRAGTFCSGGCWDHAERKVERGSADLVKAKDPTVLSARASRAIAWLEHGASYVPR